MIIILDSIQNWDQIILTSYKYITLRSWRFSHANEEQIQRNTTKTEKHSILIEDLLNCVLYFS